jgi:DNA-binding GntR family transcriptional regulator
VASLDVEVVEHLFEVMMGLEGQSGQLAATRRSTEQMAELEALHFDMLAAHRRRDLPRYYQANQAIHQAINRAAANPILSETYDQLNGRIQNLRFRSNFDQAKWDAAVQEHEQMIKALKNQDSLGLQNILVTHLRNKRDVVVEQLRQAQAA